MSDLAPRPRSAAELVDAAVQLYRRSPGQLTLAAALIYVPWLLIQLALTATLGIGDMQAGAFPGFGALMGLLFISLSSFVVYGLVDASILRIAAALYVGQELDAIEAIKGVVGRVWLYVWISFVRSLGIGLGLIMIIFPGVYFYTKWAVVIPVAVLEGKGADASFTRSGDLSQGLKLHVFVTMFLVMVIYFVLAVMLAWVSRFVGSTVFTQVVSTAVVIVLYPMVGVTTTLLYYDLRIRREGYDIELMAAMSGGGGSPATGAAPA
ncbi:MAG TPA: hypothetical protein VMH39_16635 [Gemmatimonadaceae bacterium]|nr:hypothetical protein [Gemmatimonadaceae bacterium]